MSMPQAVRHINAMRALETIFRAGPMSRASLARALGLTRSTVGNIVSELVAEGWLAESPPSHEAERSARTGRPGTLVRLRAGHATFLGADIAVGRITIVAIDLEARIVASLAEDIRPVEETPERTTARVVALIRDILARLPEGRRPRGVCVTVPGAVDDAGNVLHLPLLSWRDVPLKAWLRDALPAAEAILVENDANAFAMAERYPAPIASASSLSIHILMDAGLGGAIVVDGRLQRGEHGFAGEFGHIPLGDRGFTDTVGLPGSLESFVGREAVLARHRFHGGNAATLDELVARVKMGEAAARATLEDWAGAFGRALATLAAIFDPGEIVVGGSVAVLFDLAREPVDRAMRSQLMPGRPAPHLKRSQLGPDGVAYGAATLLHRDAMAVRDDLVFGAGLGIGVNTLAGGHDAAGPRRRTGNRRTL
ncbi:ROK family transcriptional regulator [Aureimonas sp. AU22]|uniref:ROK family transcriptional regulator n=1 Tax=Aureimonas sp. AU22 TaxID=1638162 RepID=UPI000784565D|nr:ROK family transcriptional regulator [Aureimonas sp. AU22]